MTLYYKAHIKMTSASEKKTLVVPSNFNMNSGDARFAIVNIAGLVSATSTYINIHCPELANNHMYNTETGRLDTIGNTVLTPTLTMINESVSENTLTYPYHNIQNKHCPTLTFELKDENNVPITNLTFITFDVLIKAPRI